MIDHLTCGSKMSADLVEDDVGFIALLKLFMPQPLTVMAWIEACFVAKGGEDWNQRLFAKAKEL